MAPFRDRDRDFAPLSTRITARIQCSGTVKRRDASLTKAAKGWSDSLFARGVAGKACLACAELLDNTGTAKTVTMQSNIRQHRKAAIVFAAVKGDALASRPRLQLGTPAVQILAGTEEWRVFRRIEGMTKGLLLCGKVIPPCWSKEAALVQ
jgi:hypothetical protein